MTTPDVIIDFGGSSGWSWDYLRNTFPSHTISSCTIVELESVVKHMQGSGLHGDVVNYQTMEEPLGSCDPLYSNSVLQYFESNAPLLSLIKHATPDLVFLEDTIARGEEDFFQCRLISTLSFPIGF